MNDSLTNLSVGIASAALAVADRAASPPLIARLTAQVMTSCIELMESNILDAHAIVAVDGLPSVELIRLMDTVVASITTESGMRLTASAVMVPQPT